MCGGVCVACDYGSCRLCWLLFACVVVCGWCVRCVCSLLLFACVCCMCCLCVLLFVYAVVVRVCCCCLCGCVYGRSCFLL